MWKKSDAETRIFVIFGDFSSCIFLPIVRASEAFETLDGVRWNTAPY